MCTRTAHDVTRAWRSCRARWRRARARRHATDPGQRKIRHRRMRCRRVGLLDIILRDGSAMSRSATAGTAGCAERDGLDPVALCQTGPGHTRRRHNARTSEAGLRAWFAPGTRLSARRLRRWKLPAGQALTDNRGLAKNGAPNLPMIRHRIWWPTRWRCCCQPAPACPSLMSMRPITISPPCRANRATRSRAGVAVRPCPKSVPKPAWARGRWRR